MRKQKDKPTKHPGGRPTAYQEQYAVIAFGFALAGYTDKEMAGFFGVSEQTLNTWKQKHPKFLESIKAGKEPANAEVARGLYRSACGHRETIKRTVMADGVPVDLEVEEYYPPHPTAAIFWLKNRQPDKWRDKHEAALVDADGKGLLTSLAVEIAKSMAG